DASLGVIHTCEGRTRPDCLRTTIMVWWPKPQSPSIKADPRMSGPRTLTFRQPDDWHLHFRDGAVLKAVVPPTAMAFGRAIVMPTRVRRVPTAAMAAAYRQRIMAAVPDGCAFTPLMTCYLTDETDPADLVAGHRDGILTAAKLYPAHATTN